MTKVAQGTDRRTTHTPSNLSSSVVTILKEHIVHWHYPPDHRLTEDELCKTFGVSRSPVREALRVLAADGFVKKLPNRSYAVKQYTIEEIEELYEVRLALELYTVERLATKKQTTQLAAELADLKHTWAELLKEPSKRPEEFAILDTFFHDTLARALGNTSLLRYLRTINERLTLFRMLDFDRRDRAEHTCHQHLEILERIRVMDAPGHAPPCRGISRKDATSSRQRSKMRWPGPISRNVRQPSHDGTIAGCRCTQIALP